jgi:hypothetical protein
MFTMNRICWASQSGGMLLSRIAEVMRLDAVNVACVSAQFANLLQARRAVHLHAYLDYSSRSLKCLTHALDMPWTKPQSLFVDRHSLPA